MSYGQALLECEMVIGPGEGHEGLVDAIVATVTGHGIAHVDRLPEDDGTQRLLFAGGSVPLGRAALAGLATAHRADATGGASASGSRPNDGRSARAGESVTTVGSEVSEVDAVAAVLRLVVRPIFEAGHDTAEVVARRLTQLAMREHGITIESGDSSEAKNSGVILMSAPRRVLCIAFIDESDRDHSEHVAKLAAAIDGRSGGFADVRARVLGRDENAEATPIEIEIDRPERTSPRRVLSTLRHEARVRGTRVIRAEILGRWPADIVRGAAARSLGIAEIDADHIHADVGVDDNQGSAEAPYSFVGELAGDAATPAGTSAAAVCGAMSAGLARMIASVTLGREPKAESAEALRRVVDRASEMHGTLLGLVSKDAESYESVMSAYQLPRHGTGADDRRTAIQNALRDATQIPLTIVRQCVQALELIEVAAEHGHQSTVVDAGTAGRMAHAAARGAALGVDAHVVGLTDLAEGDRYRRACSALVETADAAAERIAEAVERRARTTARTG